MELDDKVRKQVEKWRDKYLNTSIKHNNLLNMNPDRKGKVTDTIRLLANEKYSLDSFWRIAADRGGAAEYSLSGASFFVRKGSRIEWETMGDGRHTTDCLDKVIAQGNSAIVQRGENPVCLVFGKLTWCVRRESDADADYGEVVSVLLDGPAPAGNAVQSAQDAQEAGISGWYAGSQGAEEPAEGMPAQGAGNTDVPGVQIDWDVQGGESVQPMQPLQPIQGTDQGVQPIQGAQGVQDIQGVQGVHGAQGTQGTQGAQGAGQDEPVQKIDYIRISTPVIFVPVKIAKIGNSYWLNPVSADSNEAAINPVLIKRYGEEGYRNFPLPVQGQSIDFSFDSPEYDSFDLHEYFAQFKKMCASMPEELGFELDDSFVGLDAFDYSRICMYRDVLRNEDSIVANPVIRAMFGEDIRLPGRDALEIRKIDEASSAGLLDRMDPRNSFEILDSDSSQYEAVERFKHGESFVLEGPPGTGKTQTIVNMLAEAIMAHKKVLFVSGKMSALNTVIKKLQLMPGVNIDKHCLLINGDDETKKNSISETYGKLQASYNAPPAPLNEMQYQDNVRKLTFARTSLEGYNKELWSRNNSLKMSLYDIAGRILSLGYTGSYVRLAIPDEQIKKLTRDDLEARALKMEQIQRLLIDLLLRSGTLARDVWYGYRKTEFTGTDASILNGYCGSMQDALNALDHAYGCVAAAGFGSGFGTAVSGITGFGTISSGTAVSGVSGTSGSGTGLDLERVAEDLKSLPVSSVMAVADRRLAQDIEGLFSGSFKQQMQALDAEKERAKGYTEAADRYFAVATEDPLSYVDASKTRDTRDTRGMVDTRAMRAKLANAGQYAGMKLSEVNAELDKLRIVCNTLDKVSGKQNGRIDSLSIRDIQELIADIDSIIDGDAKAVKIEKEINRSYDDSIFKYDYTKLLEKLRTKWRDNVSRRRDPFGFKGQIKDIMKCCFDTTVDFNIVYVNDLILKLDTLRQVNENEAQKRSNLTAYGLDGENITINIFMILRDVMQMYLSEKEDFTVQNILGGSKVGFRRFAQDKAEDLKNIAECVEAFGVKQDITVQDLLTLPDDYDTVYAENKRIASDRVLSGILPSLQRGCRTSWDELAGILSIVADILQRSGAGKNTNTEQQKALVTSVCAALAESGFAEKAQRVLDIYSKFYAEDIWFIPGSVTSKRRADAMTYEDFKTWLKDAKDINHIEEYVAYRNLTAEMDGKLEGTFFREYIKRSRRDYPIDRIADGYRISVLWSYYEYLTAEGRMVAKLSAGHGLEDMISQYAKADADMHEYNRRLVDITLASGISHNTTMHSYLETQTQDRNYSVRKLLKYRHDSIMQLTPVIMMSVYSVSKLLPYGLYDFDAVIFDEASQIPEEDALTSIMRTTKQVVISGDPKQMPAISYFTTKSPEVHDEDDDSAIACASIIDFILNSYDNKIRTYSLKTHYRSNHESLIKYSNENPSLYGGKLVTFPSPKEREEDFGLWNYCMEDEVPVICGGEGQNETEAKKVCELIRAHFKKYPLPGRAEGDIEKYNKEHSLGVIVFGIRQKGRILDMMNADKELKKIAQYGDNRVFSITPVDEIQGDEMCEMILSLTYGRNAEGGISTAWGHMNQLPVALYKFNVAVTRARDNLKFVHSVRAEDIDRSGAKTLGYVADYLRQFNDPVTAGTAAGSGSTFVNTAGTAGNTAAAGGTGALDIFANNGNGNSNGSTGAATGSAGGTSDSAGAAGGTSNSGAAAAGTQFISRTDLNTDFVEAIGAICESIVGKDRVVYNFGASARSYRVPVSVLSEDRTHVVLGIMCETDRGSQGFAMREYFRTCNSIMESHGWDNLYKAYAIRWLRNYRTERDALEQRIREACGIK